MIRECNHAKLFRRLRQAVSFMKYLTVAMHLSASYYLMQVVFYSTALAAPESRPGMVAVSETLRVISLYNY